MAYGSKNNRKKILSSIVEGADGGSIMGALEASMKEEDNRSKGKGAIVAAKSLEDTYEKVSSMKRSLGEKQQATNEAINNSRSSDSSIAKDWMTVLSGQAESDKPANEIKRSEMVARRVGNPQTVNEDLTPAGKPVKSKVIPVSNIDGLGSRPSSASKDKSTIEFIAGFENVPQDSFKAYWDNDHWSIGFGTRASGEDEVITLEQAQDRLANETSKFQGVVEKHMKKHKYKWNANQVAALTSFTFNLGETNLNNLTENGNRDVSEILKMIPSYNKADGKELKGLVERRRSEADLFSTQP